MSDYNDDDDVIGTSDETGEKIVLTPEQVFATIKGSITTMSYIYRYCMLMYTEYLNMSEKYTAMAETLELKQTEYKALRSQLKQAFTDISDRDELIDSLTEELAATKKQIEDNKQEEVTETNGIQRTEEEIETQQ